MSSMLRGNALAKVDEKGRLKLPKSFRNVIEPEYGTEFFVTSHGGGSIQVYPMAVWEEIELRLVAHLPREACLAQRGIGLLERGLRDRHQPIAERGIVVGLGDVEQ